LRASACSARGPSAPETGRRPRQAFLRYATR
jgi:hypothetical protein